MDKFFLKVLHEEPLDRLNLESIKGGLTCLCNSGNLVCDCKGGDLCSCLKSNIHDCPCNNGTLQCPCNSSSLATAN